MKTRMHQILLAVATLYVAGSAMPVADPQIMLPLGRPPFFQRPLRPRPGGILSGFFPNGQQQPGVPATPAVGAEAPKSPEAVVPQSPVPATPAVSPTGEVAVPKDPGSFFTSGAPTMGSNAQINGLLGMLNGGQLGSATAGGAGNGAVQDSAAIGQGTGIANVGPGGFGIGLGIGGAIATPLGNLAFGQGDSIAVGK